MQQNKSKAFEIFSLFKQFESEKGLAVTGGLNRQMNDRILLVDGL